MQETSRLIQQEHEEVLERERIVLDGLIELARAVDADGNAQENAEMLRRHLEEPFLLVIVGEVKSGKSTFINALLGEEICAEGPTPLTDKIHVLQFGDNRESKLLEEFLMEHRLPIELLREVHIVDTPGTNSILKEHSAITERFIPRSDLVLFLTSMDRPYSESENNFLAHISDRWRKKVVFLLSKIDGRREPDVQEVLDFVRRSCLEHHHFEPRVLPISAREAKEGGEGGMGEVRELIRATLAGGEKMKLKLQSPLRSSHAVLETLDARIQARSGLLTEDFKSIQELDRHVEQSAKELKERSFRFVTKIYDLFSACQGRARTFFNDFVKLRNVGRMRSSEKVQEEFHRQVIAQLEEEFAQTLQAAVDWLTKETIALHERATEALHDQVRPKSAGQVALPKEASRFEYRREEAFQNIVEGYNRHLLEMDLGGETRRLMAEMQKGFTRQMGVTATALIVGAGSVALLSPLWASLGVISAVGLGITGFVFLPAVRRQALRRFSERSEQLLTRIRETFVEVFALEVDGVIERLRRGWEPFLVFYRAETEAVSQQKLRLQGLRRDVLELEDQLQKLGSSSTSSPPADETAESSD